MVWLGLVALLYFLFPAFFALYVLLAPLFYVLLFAFLVYLAVWGILRFVNHRRQQRALRKIVQDYVARRRAEISASYKAPHS
ncbi:MAG: hypothetical protein WHS43_06980 [Aquificaceae bacterium]|uniref:hypothetical protein n=1 Tax=Hydrogenobacter TaxID=939 RepID=UPI001C74712F|nr:hypothetical protein [Hydrogenobacter thermophilus]QWK20462.1 MAG: hypothetical protein KNN13_03850 [Hydrogenobacter thermophilus]